MNTDSTLVGRLTVQVHTLDSRESLHAAFKDYAYDRFGMRASIHEIHYRGGDMWTIVYANDP